MLSPPCSVRIICRIICFGADCSDRRRVGGVGCRGRGLDLSLELELRQSAALRSLKLLLASGLREDARRDINAREAIELEQEQRHTP